MMSGAGGSAGASPSRAYRLVLVIGAVMGSCAPALAGVEPIPVGDEPFREFIGGLIEGFFAEDEAAPQEPAAGELRGGISLIEDAASRRRISQAQRLIAAGRAEEAAQGLGRLVESLGERDVFLATDARSAHGAKAEIRRLVADAPPEVRSAYEIVFGPAAQRMLEESPHDPATIRHVASLYPQTRAGAQALQQLARIRFDEGRTEEATATLERLRTLHGEEAARFEPALAVRLTLARSRAGERDEAAAAFADVQRRAAGGAVILAGVRIGQPAAGVSLEQFIKSAGDAAFAVQPKRSVDWKTPLLIPRWSSKLDNIEEHSPTSRRATCVGELALVPERGGFAAYDLASGTRRWEYRATRGERGGAKGFWNGLAGGELASDGRAAYLVEEDDSHDAGGHVPAFGGRTRNLRVGGVIWMARPNAAPGVNRITATAAVGRVSNVLTALEVAPPRQGNRRWRVGGRSGHDEAGLAGHVFLGAPLAVEGRLFALTECARSVQLVVLDAETGKLEWGMELGAAEESIDDDSERRGISATPVLERGTLLCPTGGGSVVAIDVDDRTLRWGYRFPRRSMMTTDGVEVSEDAAGVETAGGWVDLAVLLAGDRVLLATPESDELHCLDGESGTVLWRRPRGTDQLLAGGADGRVVLIGPKSARFVNLTDGSTVGAAVPFGERVGPAGRGYVADGGACIVPLTNGSVLRIDLETGAATTWGGTSRGISLGGLTRYEGTLVSVDAGFVRAFDGREALEQAIEKRLEVRPDDAIAFSRRADLRSADGQYAEAIEDCRAAFRAAPSPKTRNRLIAALLDGVREGLPGRSAYDAELERLAAEP